MWLKPCLVRGEHSPRKRCARSRRAEGTCVYVLFSAGSKVPVTERKPSQAPPEGVKEALRDTSATTPRRGRGGEGTRGQAVGSGAKSPGSGVPQTGLARCVPPLKRLHHVALRVPHL